MTVGNLAALRQTNLKRLLAYSSIAHAGYLLVGVAAGGSLGASAVLFYLLAYTLMNVGAFAVVIAVGRWDTTTEKAVTLDSLAGLAYRKRWLAAAMALFMLSLAGVPPLVGFLAKFYIFSAAVQAGLTWLAIIGVINSVVSAYYYLRVVVMMYMHEGQLAPDQGNPVCLALQIGVGIAAVGIVAWGLWPGPILELARLAATALLGG
jgi:NADH-quinone oxidoreductase subunit N